MENKRTHKYLARIIIEAATPLAVGSGERDVMTDQLVAKDANGLPYIPGTALAGLLKHAVKKGIAEQLFGKQEIIEEDGAEVNNSRGSDIVISSAQMIGDDGLIVDGLKSIDFTTEFYHAFQHLPVRQHVCISHRGAAAHGGKFDEEIAYKGSRFCFEMELTGGEQLQQTWDEILEEFAKPGFRIGGGTRKGFGEISVIEIKQRTIDLRKELDDYLGKTSCLNDEFWSSLTGQKPKPCNTDEWTTYELELQPDDFFLFSSGLESEDADMTYVTEKVIEWSKDPLPKPGFSDEKVLIPVSSVKGAIAHRLAFHYNEFAGVYADDLIKPDMLNTLKSKGYDPEALVKFDSGKPGDLFELCSKGNPAVIALFGYSAKDEKGQRGNALFSDFYITDSSPRSKLLNHVAIDRFTGGAMEGALFSEEVVYAPETLIKFRMVVNRKTIDENESVKDALHLTLADICDGMLPLGGGSMRGHGCFKGKIIKDGKELTHEK